MMKKLIAILIALTLTASVALAETAVGMADPWIELDSLEALNEAAGTDLQLPGVMGVSDEVYRLLQNEEGTIAELKYQVNGVNWTFRASPDMGTDISGVWLDTGRTAFEGSEETELAFAATDTMKLARWQDVNAQYVLMVEDNGEMDDETFQGIVDEMRAATNPFDPAALSEGSYDDSTSQRATAEVTYNGDGLYSIIVHWSSSAQEYDQWTMTARLTEDGLLSYEDCEEKVITLSDTGAEQETVANIIPTGYFVMIDSATFDWSGAAEESCRDCVFVLAQ